MNESSLDDLRMNINECLQSSHSKVYEILNQKTYRFTKKEYIGSTAQKKTNEITKFLINAFL